MANRTGARVASYRIKAVQDEHSPALQTTHLELRSARRVLVDKGSRGAGTVAQPMEVRNDELVKVVFDDHHHLWLRADELRDLHGRAPESRGPGEEDLIELDLQVSESGERGLLSAGIKALEFFGIDLKQASAGKLGALVDGKRLLLGREALYRCNLDAPEAPLSPLGAGKLPGEQPLLVFIHGTFSNFVAAYGGLMSEGGDEAGQAATQLRAALKQQYGEQVFAFEHQTLTRSPVQNAQVLVDTLPVGAQLHLVTHSRGGLIGELLALAERVREGDRLEELIRLVYEAADPQRLRPPGLPALDDKDARALAQAYRDDGKRLRALVQAMDRKGIRVRRFVRVACPARGTTLASARLDRWLGVLQSVVPDSFVGDALDFLLAVLKERTDARVMPGIEAMMPGSALTRLLNAGLVTDADLSVIAGDTQGSGFFNRLKAFVADWFYGAENDLVVNSGSMSGGLIRPPGKARALEDRGSHVTHGRYFLNTGSLGWLRSGLLRSDADAGGFADIVLARQEEPRARGALDDSRADTRKRPIVVFVPGAMGSSLWVGEEEIWVNRLALLMGGMSRIDIKTTVRAAEPLEDFYGPLIEFLAREYRVSAVPYDWRKSVTANAKELLTVLADQVKRAEQDGVALHIVAHSMGGLVARCLIADQAEGLALWQRIGKLPGGPGRLLMLGTPNHGSSEAVRWLTGHNPTQAKLAFLDLKHSVFDLMEMVRRFPGLVELLPFGTDELEERTCNAQTWQELQKLCGARVRLVEPHALDEARKTWTRLRAAPVDPERMCYVAGCASATVVGHVVETDELTGFRRIAWEATRDGDGTVSWASSELPGLKLWYAPDTSHDELCSNESDRRIFQAYRDLLKTGRTDLLPSVAPSSRGAGKTFKLMQPPLDAMPGEADLRGLGLGGMPRRARSSRQGAPSLKVSVRHGNLQVAARHPVVVGHYQGDLLVNAEGAIDRALDRALSQASAQGIYPGAAGTSKSFFSAPRPAGSKAAAVTLKGALVLGLGQVGELTASRLRATVRDGMLEHARQVAQAQPADAACVALGFSCLLVGSGDTGLDVRESVESLLRGALDANRKLCDTGQDVRVLITELEFIELYEDQAVAAGHALNSVRKARDLERQVRWEPAEVEGATRYGGQRRSQYDTNQSWDQRVEIIEHTKDDGSNRPPGTLSFSIAGARAPIS
jgi:pimeloyl-ACP methyl ester carboxylesterase